MKPTEAVDVSGFARLLGLEQPLDAAAIDALYKFIGAHHPLHEIVVWLGRGIEQLDPAELDRVRLACGFDHGTFQATLIQMIRAFVFTPKVAAEPEVKPAVRRPHGAAATTAETEEAETAPAKTKRKYHRKGKAKAKRTKGRPPAQSVGEKVPLPDKVRQLIGAAKKRGEKPKQTLQRVLAEHPGPRYFCEFANPILRKAGIRGFSPGQYHQLADFDFRGWRA